MKTYAFNATPQWFERCDNALETAKTSEFAAQTPVNRTEIVRQASLIGFEVIQLLGNDFSGYPATRELLTKLIAQHNAKRGK